VLNPILKTWQKGKGRTLLNSILSDDTQNLTLGFFACHKYKTDASVCDAQTLN
jgi:hypothetical protein